MHDLKITCIIVSDKLNYEEFMMNSFQIGHQNATFSKIGTEMTTPGTCSFCFVHIRNFF